MTKRTRAKPIVDIRALDYIWVEIAADGITTEPKRAWRIQYRRDGEAVWTPLPIITIKTPPPEES
jgi:hypothetical protein